jgi:hypothetical protein
MTVCELIAILQQHDPAAVVGLRDCQEPGAVRELQKIEIKSTALYRTDPDRAPRLNASRGQPLQALLLGSR